jgi:hypothetical protein
MSERWCTAPVFDSNGMGCGPCGEPLQCGDHPGETSCKRCGFPRKLHDFRHDYPLNSGICKSFDERA